MRQQIAPASRGISRVKELEVMELLHEMLDGLVADFGFSRSHSLRQVAARRRRRADRATAR